jgi:uncharacterized membrane protein
MTTKQKIASYGVPILIAAGSFIIMNNPWNIVTLILIIFIMYLIYELDHAKQMPDDYEG